MTIHSSLNPWKDNVLFTPGPLTTSRTVKQAMLRDLGARDSEFLAVVGDIRNRLLDLAGVKAGEFEAILMQGSGTYGVESVISSAIPPDGKLLVIANGAYGNRIAKMASLLKIDLTHLHYSENQTPDLDEIDRVLAEDDRITHVAVVHCETTSGIVNPIERIGSLVSRRKRIYIVDAMSSFGAVPIDMNSSSIDYLISSANKCIEGIPGFSYVLARRELLLATKGYARCLSLDLLDQWSYMETVGQFRFTPPVQSLMAFHQALLELESEGGVEGRAKRYRNNFDVLIQGMRELGFREYLRPEQQSYIITTFLYPNDPLFSFDVFYQKLNERGYSIYCGKVSDAQCFRIGSIGRIMANDIRDLLATIHATLQEMGIATPVRY